VHATLDLKIAVGVLTLDQDRRGLDAGLLTRMVVDHLDLVAVALAPARVHAQEHFGPILALGAASAGIDLDIAAVGIRLTSEQSRYLVALCTVGEFTKAAHGIVGERLVAFGLGKLQKFGRVG